MAKKKETREVKFKYHADLAEAFEIGRKQFCKDTMIELTGITWEVRGNHVCISITEEQKEQWLFHLAFCIGKAYGWNSYKLNCMDLHEDSEAY